MYVLPQAIPRRATELFAQRWVQCLVGALLLAVVVGGAIFFPKFIDALKTGVSPPSGSRSAKAKSMYSKLFEAPSATMTLLVQSKDNSAIINATAPLLFAQSDPYIINNFETPLTQVARNLSRTLKSLLSVVSNECNASFTSFWDAEEYSSGVETDLAGALFRDSFFNDDGSSTIMVGAALPGVRGVVVGQCPNLSAAWQARCYPHSYSTAAAVGITPGLS